MATMHKLAEEQMSPTGSIWLSPVHLLLLQSTSPPPSLAVLELSTRNEPSPCFLFYSELSWWRSYLRRGEAAAAATTMA